MAICVGETQENNGMFEHDIVRKGVTMKMMINREIWLKNLQIGIRTEEW